MTRKLAVTLLKDGRCHAKGLYSAKTGKTFDADLVLTEAKDKSGNRIASYKLEFPNSPKYSKSH